MIRLGTTDVMPIINFPNEQILEEELNAL